MRLAYIKPIHKSINQRAHSVSNMGISFSLTLHLLYSSIPYQIYRKLLKENFIQNIFIIIISGNYLLIYLEIVY